MTLNHIITVVGSSQFVFWKVIYFGLIFLFLFFNKRLFFLETGYNPVMAQPS